MENENCVVRKRKIELSHKQIWACESKTRGNILLFGIGGGKSHFLSYKSLYGAFNGRTSAIISYSYRNLVDTIINSVKKVVLKMQLKHWQYDILRGDMLVRVYSDDYQSGTDIMLRSGDDPDHLRGPNLHDFYIDEGREFPNNSVWLVMLGRIREVPDSKWYVVSSPRGKDWMYDLVANEGLTNVFENDTGYAANENLTVIVQPTKENPFLPDEYINDLVRQYTGPYASQELNAAIVELTGGLFKREWFTKKDPYYKPARGVRGWDLAVSIKTAADSSSGVLLAKKGAVTNIVDVIRTKRMYPDLKELIIETAIKDGAGVTIGIENVGMQLAVVQDLMADPRLAKYTVRPYTPRGDKYNRALPLAPRMEQGIIRLCEGPWNGAFIDELCGFSPDLKKHDDQVDGCGTAYELINKESALKSFVAGIFPFTQEQKIELITVSAIELENFTAHIVRAVWQPYLGVLQIIDELETNTVDGIVSAMIKSRHRLADEKLDTESYKSLCNSLIKAKCNVMPSKLDVDGGVYTFNAMTNKIYVPVQCKTYSELLSFDKDTDTPNPYLRCVLRICQEVKTWKRDIPYEKKPFDDKRGIIYRQKLAVSRPVKGWV